MKYITILGDGMADEPLEALGGKTPLMAAKTPMMDEIAARGEIGLAATIPEGMKPGSDTANLAVLGYDPRSYYTGRSPLEALSIGVDMKPTDIALRCNLVTLSEEEGIPYEARTILDHSSGEISTEDAAVLIEAVRKEFQNETYQFYVGTSYRHLLIWNHGEVLDLSQPHDHLAEVIGPYLTGDAPLRRMMERSYEILNHHPINEARAAQGLNKANSLWFWGAGTRPSLQSFTGKTGKRGAMISAVDLLKGIAIGAKMQVMQVPGANGGLHTNYRGKAEAAVRALTEDGNDFVYVHIEAPDEMGHQGAVDRKVQAIEYLDGQVIRPVFEALTAQGVAFRMLIMPDHPTPIRVRTHTAAPVPYLLYDSRKALGHWEAYNEETGAQSGILLKEGFRIADRLFAE